jgi:hypothetical protein
MDQQADLFGNTDAANWVKPCNRSIPSAIVEALSS